MFRKLFGKHKNNKRKKRLSPSAATAEGLMNDHPMYQYAMKEYAQTVPAQMGNDDGRIRQTFSMNDEQQDAVVLGEDMEALSGIGTMSIDADENATSSGSAVHAAAASSVGGAPSMTSSSFPGNAAAAAAATLPTPILRVPSNRSDATGVSSLRSPKLYHRIVFSPKTEYLFSEEEDEEDASWQQQQQQQQSSKRQGTTTIYHEPPMPDTTYEEWYGDAYVGGPIRYIYPSGYQSMRPRSGPWKLSIIVCLSFTWLSVFVIGHCSDKADQAADGFYNYNNYYGNNNNNNNGYYQQIDDDKLAIETKWCGSRLLYWMWVISMLITGLATAYCSVIGYIKVRDFAVANSRSQPPGVVVAKSDYYVQIMDHPNIGDRVGGVGVGNVVAGPVHPSKYHKTIYQADGTPQFWGNQIYRPTQAAVAITSR